MPTLAIDLALIGAAVLLAALGGEAFLKAILGIARQLRVPNAVVATTVAAFATSSPELTVSTVAALAGQPEIGLGDALGSNVVNIALIFGIALLFGPIRSTRDDFGRDFILALLVPCMTLFFVLDGRIEQSEGGLLLLVFFIWLGVMLHAALRYRQSALNCVSDSPTLGPLATLAHGAFGLTALIAAGRLFVIGATGVASAFQIDTYVIGVLVVAIGTSLPELVTVVLSRLRGHDDVGVGTLIGSNIFNGLLIVGVAASIHPISAPLAEIAVTLIAGVVALLMLLPGKSGLIPCGRGLMLLALYGIFVLATLGAGHQPISFL